MRVLIDKQDAIDVLRTCYDTETISMDNGDEYINYGDAVGGIEQLSSAQPEYEPVTAEDFAKTMSENTLYSFMTWYGEALGLMERQGFVICKKTM